MTARSRLPVLLGAAALAMLVLFLAFGAGLERWAGDAMAASSGDAVLALLILALLTGDIVLPVPSSTLAIASGVAFGTAGGALLAATGLTLGGTAAFFLARHGVLRFRDPGGAPGAGWTARLLHRHGVLLLVALRPVPILAEVSVIAAGAGGMPPRRALPAIALSNLGIALAYAALGNAAARPGGILLVLAAALAVPGLLYIAGHLLTQAPNTRRRP